MYLQFVHTLNGDPSKTGKNHKKATVNNIVIFMIFAAFDTSPLTVCINCSL